jgi:hypothetical protein
VAAFTLSVIFSGGQGGGAKTSGGPTGLTAMSTPTTAEQGTALSPGQTGFLYVKVNNASGGALKLNSWTPSGGVTVNTSDGTCDQSSFDVLTVNSLAIVVPTGISVVAIPAAITLHASPQPGCSNGSFSVSGTGVFGF